MKKLIILFCFAMISTFAYATESDKRIEDVVKTPFNDLNLSRDEIPTILENARNNPYVLATDNSCTSLKQEIEDLTAVLGPDLDATVEEKSNYEKAGNAAFNALNKTVQGAIPYRSWIRKLTGAEKHAKKLDAAVKAGNARRSFLKGVSKNSCPVETTVPIKEESVENTKEAIEEVKHLEESDCYHY